jgi:hypothetical protein
MHFNDHDRRDMKHPPLSVSERLSVLNALMAQDRVEIRDKQEAVFKLTYYVVPAVIGIAAFSVENSKFRNVLILGQILLLALYVMAFFTFRKWLMEARACLQIREAFYKEPHRLYADPFEPIRKIEPKDRMSRFEDKALWFPFSVTVVSTLVLVAYMLCHSEY